MVSIAVVLPAIHILFLFNLHSSLETASNTVNRWKNTVQNNAVWQYKPILQLMINSKLKMSLVSNHQDKGYEAQDEYNRFTFYWNTRHIDFVTLFWYNTNLLIYCMHIFFSIKTSCHTVCVVTVATQRNWKNKMEMSQSSRSLTWAFFLFPVVPPTQLCHM